MNLPQTNILFSDLKAAIETIQTSPEKRIDIRNHGQAILRIRYMPTGGGMQFCVKDVVGFSEGSGIYYQPNLLDNFSAYVYMRIHDYCESRRRLQKRFNKARSDGESRMIGDLSLDLHIQTEVN